MGGVMNNNELAKGINLMVMQDKFVNKDTDKYIYASLSQPPIKIIDKNGSNDELDYTVECPNCHRHVNYGNSIFTLAGHIYCDDENCRKQVYEEYYGSDG